MPTVAATGPSDIATLSALSRAPSVPRSPLPKGKLILSMVLALVIIAGSCGLFFAIQSHQATTRASATATTIGFNRATVMARNASATAYPAILVATATAQAHTTATVSAIIANPYPSSFPGNGTLALYDSLHNDRYGNAWDKEGNCTFTGDTYHSIVSDYPS